MKYPKILFWTDSKNMERMDAKRECYIYGDKTATKQG
jgi:hypothetical protein